MLRFACSSWGAFRGLSEGTSVGQSIGGPSFGAIGGRIKNGAGVFSRDISLGTTLSELIWRQKMPPFPKNMCIYICIPNDQVALVFVTINI